AVDALDVLDRCPAPGYAYVKEMQAEQDGGTLKFDIQVLDEHGKICVQIKGLSLRTLDGEKSEPLFFLPEWTGQSEETGTIAETDYGQRWIVVCATADSAFDGQSISALRERLPQAKVQLLTVPVGFDIAQRSTDAVLQLFEIVRRLLREGVRRPLLMQVLLPGGEEEVRFSGLSGLLKTAQLENPRFMSQLISPEPGENAEGLVRKLEENSRSVLSAEILYRRGERFVNRWVETKPEAEWIPWKDDGVYLISGGAGGLGLLFAREIVQHASNVKVILTGRSSLSSERQQNIRALEENGATIEYHQVDVTDSHAVERLLAGIRSRFGALNGIIHSAGVIRDAFLLKKERAEFEETLAAKITGVVNLDQASKDFALDFFAMFSSMSAAIGNIGQADYASGNAFLDGYSRRRNQLLSKGERTGRTVSIN